MARKKTLTELRQEILSKGVMTKHEMNHIAEKILKRRQGIRNQFYRMEVYDILRERLAVWTNEQQRKTDNKSKEVKLTDRFPIGTIVKYKKGTAIYVVVSDTEIKTKGIGYPVSNLDTLELAPYTQDYETGDIIEDSSGYKSIIKSFDHTSCVYSYYILDQDNPVGKYGEANLLDKEAKTMHLLDLQEATHKVDRKQFNKNINTNPISKMTTSKTLQELTGGNLKKFLTAANKKKLINADEALLEYKDIANALGELAGRLFIVLGQDQTKLQNAINSDDVQGMKEALAQFSQTQKDMSELLGTALKELTPKQIEVKVKSIKERL